MLLKLFTVYDSKTETYMQPFYNQTTGGALRMFEDACNSEDSTFSKYPTDFSLFEIGSFNDSDAAIQLYDAKISLGSANEYKHNLQNTPLESVK